MRGQWCPGTSQLPYARGLIVTDLGSGNNAGPWARKGEGDKWKGTACNGPASVWQRSVKCVTCSSPRLAWAGTGAQLMLHPSGRLGMQGSYAGAGGGRPALPWVLQPSAGAGDCLESLGSHVTAFGGARGGREVCRNIIIPCFPTRCHCTIISSAGCT